MGRPPTFRREHLLDSARRIFASKGFAATTLADIAGDLNVTAAAILRHTESKEALFRSAMESGEIVEPPPCIRDLATTDAHDDPRIVLRSVAVGFIPFIQGMIGARLVMAMHANSYRTSLTLPFNAAGDNPPRQAFRIVVDYFERAAAAGVIRVANPPAAALLFMGSLQGFVLTQYVLKVGPRVAAAEYIDALIDLWCEGAIVGGSNARKKKSVDPSRGRPGGAGERDRGHASVHAPATKAAPARSGGNTRSADGKRRLARGRPRRPRLR